MSLFHLPFSPFLFSAPPWGETAPETGSCLVPLSSPLHPHPGIQRTVPSAASHLPVSPLPPSVFLLHHPSEDTIDNQETHPGATISPHLRDSLRPCSAVDHHVPALLHFPGLWSARCSFPQFPFCVPLSSLRDCLHFSLLKPLPWG
ncbi:hypothetical protein H1C71_021948 [Ictidomys tridecemlineatus]|nr:hypothetical protein H1C71_021948 [Ictidomys tridecemlineatus]